MFKLSVYNQTGKIAQDIELDPEVFDGKFNEKVLYQVILMFV